MSCEKLLRFPKDIGNEGKGNSSRGR